jgi:DNA-binding LacI/PurR family transcriptional regulator
MNSLLITRLMMATILDVAQKAGVSISSVSYALTGKRPISAEKKAHIHKIIEELGYQPNASARSLASKRTRNIALLFPNLQGRSFGFSEIQFLFSGAQFSIKNGYYMVMWFVEADNPDELRRLIRQLMVDGVILMEVRNNDPFVKVLEEENIPFFLIGQDSFYKGKNYIEIDFHGSMELVLNWLLDKGHINVCFINHSFSTYKMGYIPAVKCHDSFLKICKISKIRGQEIFCEKDPESACQKVKETLLKTPGISAIVSLNQSCLAGIIKAVEDLGKNIPQDVSVVALASAPSFGASYLPLITSFEINIEKIMEQALSKLISKIDNENAPLIESMVLCELVERQSTGGHYE